MSDATEGLLSGPRYTRAELCLILANQLMAANGEARNQTNSRQVQMAADEYMTWLKRND